MLPVAVWIRADAALLSPGLVALGHSAAAGPVVQWDVLPRGQLHAQRLSLPDGSSTEQQVVRWTSEEPHTEWPITLVAAGDAKVGRVAQGVSAGRRRQL